MHDSEYTLKRIQDDQVILQDDTTPRKIRNIPHQNEHYEQVRVIQWARFMEQEYPCLRWLHSVPNGGYRNQSVAKYMKAEGVKAGVSDLFLPVSRCKFSGIYIEMKVAPNRLTRNQQHFLSFAIDNGFAGVVCYSADSAIETLEKYLHNNRDWITDHLFKPKE